MAKANWKCPNDFTEWSKWLAAGLHARNRWRLPVLLTGILFAVGLRHVASWLRAVGVSDDFQAYYYFLAALERKAASVATQLFLLLLRTLPLPDRLLAVIMTPHQAVWPEGRRGGHPPQSHARPCQPEVSLWTHLGHPVVGLAASAGGRDGLALACHAVCSPEDDSRGPRKQGWRFRTKLELAAHLVEWITTLVKKAGKTLWVVVDGGYTKGPVVEPGVATGTTVIGRFRKDAALRTCLRHCGLAGDTDAAGQHLWETQHSFAKRAGQNQGWQTMDCTLYGETIPRFTRGSSQPIDPAAKMIRVVFVKEEHDCFAFCSTNPEASMVEIVEAFTDRATIERDFHDMGEV